MWFWSANFGNREVRMVQKILEICLSETHASGNREAHAKYPSFQALLIQMKRRQWKKESKEVMKQAHKNKRWGKSTLLHWWTSATSKSKSTSRRMFARTISSVEIIKPWWRSATRISREDRWTRNKGRKFKWVQSLTKWLTVVTNGKLRGWIPIHLPLQVPSLNIPQFLIRILTNRGRYIIARKGRKLR